MICLKLELVGAVQQKIKLSSPNKHNVKNMSEFVNYVRKETNY